MKSRPAVGSPAPLAALAVGLLWLLAMALPGLHLVAEPHRLAGDGQLVHFVHEHGDGSVCAHHHGGATRPDAAPRSTPGAPAEDPERPRIAAPADGCSVHVCTHWDWLKERMGTAFGGPLCSWPVGLGAAPGSTGAASAKHPVALLHLAPKQSPPGKGGAAASPLG